MPAAQKVDDAKLMTTLARVFQTHGYDGASVSLITEATGLQRASLYHRFPGGKEQMARAVLDAADQAFVNHVLAPLTEPGKPIARARQVAKRIDAFYGSGDRPCLVDTLSLGGATDAVRRHAAATLAAVIDAMAGIAREAGATPADARRRAMDAAVQLQGALVVARTLGDRQPFRRMIRNLPDLLVANKA